MKRYVAGVAMLVAVAVLGRSPLLAQEYWPRTVLLKGQEHRYRGPAVHMTPAGAPGPGHGAAWQPASKDHREVLERVQVPREVYAAFGSACVVKHGNSGGSGAYVGERCVVTCSHLFRDEVVTEGAVTFPSGEVIGYMAVMADANDLGFLLLDREPTTAEPIPWADEDPQPGDPVYTMGFTGSSPRLGLRRMTFRTTALGNPWGTLNPGPESWPQSGDSGGPALNARGQFLGPVWGGSAEGGGTYVLTEYTRGLFKTRWRQICQGQQCYPSQQPAQGAYYQQQQAKVRVAEPSDQGWKSAITQDDLKKITDDLYYRLKASEEFRGPPGKDGVPGKDGASPDVQALSEAIAQKVEAQLPTDAELAEAVMARLPLVRLRFGVDEDGAPIVAEAPLGDEVPVPPIVVELHEDGHTFTQSRPLGGRPVKLESFAEEVRRSVKVKD